MAIQLNLMPDDLLLHTSSFLSGKDLWRLRAVSRAMHAALQNVWRELSSYAFHIMPAASFAPRFTQIEMDDASSKGHHVHKAMIQFLFSQPRFLLREIAVEKQTLIEVAALAQEELTRANECLVSVVRWLWKFQWIQMRAMQNLETPSFEDLSMQANREDWNVLVVEMRNQRQAPVEYLLEARVFSTDEEAAHIRLWLQRENPLALCPVRLQQMLLLKALPQMQMDLILTLCKTDRFRNTASYVRRMLFAKICNTGHVPLLSAFLARGGANAFDDRCWLNSLICAAKRGHAKVVSICLRVKDTPSVEELLRVALRNRNLNVMRAIFGHSRFISRICSCLLEDSAIFADEQGDMEIPCKVFRIVMQDIFPDASDRLSRLRSIPDALFGEALSNAARQDNHVPISALLPRCNADDLAKALQIRRAGRTWKQVVLHHICRYNRFDLMRAFIGTDGLKGFRDYEVIGALRTAAEEGCAEILQIAMNDEQLKGYVSDPWCFYSSARRYDHWNVMQVLLQFKRLDSNVVSSMLLRAAKKGNAEMVSAILQSKHCGKLCLNDFRLAIEDAGEHRDVCRMLQRAQARRMPVFIMRCLLCMK